MFRLALALTCLAAVAPAADPPKKPDWFSKASKEFTATCDPAEAKPGQTVTFKLTLHLNDGYTVYPTKQPDRPAAGMVSKIDFPKPGAVVFVGTLADPPSPKTKAEPELGIEKLHYYTGKVVWERKFVVNPTQAAGDVTVQLPNVKLTVCDATNCFPAKAQTPEAKLKVLAGPAVAVDPALADEVTKALAEKK